MSATTQTVVRDNQLQGVEHRTRKATPGARPAPSALSLKALRAQIVEDLKAARRSDARLAAMIILAEPSRIGDQPIGEFLMRIHGVERDRVAQWLREADVHPWRPGNCLADDQRSRLVRILSKFAKPPEDAQL